MREAIGFVGLGNMGLPMAQNLLKAGYNMHVFNRTASKAEGLLAQGAAWASSPCAVAERTGMVISMVADDEALQAVSLGTEGVFSGLPEDGIHIDMSTVSPDTTKGMARMYRERGVHFIAAPVSGRPEHAATGKLLIYPAGPEEVIERCRPLFNVMGQRVIVVGEEPHLANVMKLVTNFIVYSLNETLSETFTLAEKAGLKSEHILEMLQVLFPSPIIQLYARRISQHDFYSPGLNVRLGLKDVGLIRKLADDVATPLPLADQTYRHLLAALARGRGELDVVAVVTVIREMAGLDSEAEKRSEAVTGP